MMKIASSSAGSSGGPLWRARAKAATLGAFDPARLLDPSSESDLNSLGQLATECDEVVGEGQIQWILKPEIRSGVLRDVGRDELLNLITDAPPAPGDRLGRILQNILRDGATATRLLVGDLGLLRTALQFVGPALNTRDVRQATQQVNLLLSRQDAEKAEQVLLPRQLVGRKAELGKMQRFVHSSPGVAAEHIFWITGVGGSGKSALLAEFSRRLRGKDWGGTPVLQIDFDRPAFYRGTLTTLMMEVSRQLEMYFPYMEPALSDYRRAARSGASDSEYTKSLSYESLNVREHEAASAWNQAMRQHLPIQRKLVLVLDTAEEVGQSSDFDLAGLRQWLRQLRTREGFPELRVVLSGRAFHADQLTLIPRRHRLELGDLAPPDAFTLLQSLLERKNVIGDFPLAELVDMLGGNPLSMKILAEYLAEGGERAARELLEDRTGFDKRFAQSFLYKRILGRLRTEDQDLVKVAHPGLVLRRVTPHLIREVLAAPCEIGNVEKARSESLFRQLSGQVWLVQGTGIPDVVIHRRDLRRLMLQAMTAEDTVRALAIHRAAAIYYRQERDPFMTSEEQAIEGLYHALFVPDAEFPESDLLDAFARTLGEDLETVPLPARAHVKLQLGRALTITEQQVLSEADLRLYRSTQQRKSLKLTGRSLPSVSASFAPQQPTLAVDAREVVSALHAAFESGNLSAVARSAEPAVQDFADSLLRDDMARVETDLTESAVWRAAVATMGRESFVASLQDSFPAMAGRNWSYPAIGASRAALSAGDVYGMLFRLHGADCPLPFNRETWNRRPQRVTVTQSLRRFQLLDETKNNLVEISVRLLRDLAPSHTAFFRNGPRSNKIYLNKSAEGDLIRLDGLRRGNRKVTLSDLDQLSKRESVLEIYDVRELSPDAKDLLVGRLPEIYVLVRVAARACPLGVLMEFAAQAAQDRLWPIELAPEALRTNFADDRERWTATLVATVDRFGLLRRFVDWLEDRGRLKGRQQLLVRTVRDYELRLRQFL
jgi:hypothetical protein